jgi:hypothetical protein
MQNVRFPACQVVKKCINNLYLIHNVRILIFCLSRDGLHSAQNLYIYDIESQGWSICFANPIPGSIFGQNL